MKGKEIEDVIPKNASQNESESQKCRKLKMCALKAKVCILENLPISCEYRT